MGYVLDTSALMRLLLDEPGADQVQRIVEGDNPVALPFMTVMEIQYTLLRWLPRAQVEQIVATLRARPVEIVESDLAWGGLAAQVKSRGGLSLADAWIVTLALQQNFTLLHQGPESSDSVPDLRAQKMGSTPEAGR